MMEAEMKWIEDGPNTDARARSAPVVAGVKPRRAHTKSRSGCSTCKSRRKKCDEARPACGQCESKGIRCDYLSAHGDATQSAVLSQGQSQYSMSRQNARGDLAEVLELVGEHNASMATSSSTRVDVLQLIDHFLSEQHPWMGTPATQSAFQKHAMRLGVDAPHLLHAIVAFSAAHIDHLDPNPKLRVAAVHHYGRLVELYAAHLRHLGTETVNHLFGTCVLLTMLSYLVVGYDNPDLLCNPEEQEGNWDAFRSLGGVRIMQGVPAYRAQLSQGVWSTMMQEAGQWKEKADKEPMITPTWWSNIMEQLCDLCNVSRDFQHGDVIYLDALCGLNKNLYGSLDDTKIGQLMHYIGGLSPAFSEALEQSDPRATLIIIYWHSLLLLIGQWWAARTGILACRRAIAYLWRVGGEGVKKLLVFPAALCGLDLQSLDRLQSSRQVDAVSVSPLSAVQQMYLS